MKRLVKYIILFVFITVFVIAGILIARGHQPFDRAKEEAELVARKYAGLEKTDDFYWFNRENTYFSVLGENGQGEKIAVLIPQNGGKISVLKQEDGISKDQALKEVTEKYHPEKITKVALGIFKDEPVWEVTAMNKQKELSYFIVSFKDGKIEDAIENM